MENSLHLKGLRRNSAYEFSVSAIVFSDPSETSGIIHLRPMGRSSSLEMVLEIPEAPEVINFDESTIHSDKSLQRGIDAGLNRLIIIISSLDQEKAIAIKQEEDEYICMICGTTMIARLREHINAEHSFLRVKERIFFVEMGKI